MLASILLGVGLNLDRWRCGGVGPDRAGSWSHLRDGSRLCRFSKAVHAASSRGLLRQARQTQHEVSPRLSHTVDKTTGVGADQSIALDGFYTRRDYPAHLRRIRLRLTPDSFHADRNQPRKLWVRLRRSNVSAVAAAFLESGHRGSISAAARCDILELANTCSQCSWNASRFHDV